MPRSYGCEIVAFSGRTLCHSVMAVARHPAFTALIHTSMLMAKNDEVQIPIERCKEL